MVKSKTRSKHRKIKLSKKLLVLIVCGVVLLAASVFGLVKLLGKDEPAAKTASSKGDTAVTDSNDSDSTTSPAPGGAANSKDKTTTTPAANPNAELKDPSGTFISNH